MLNMWHSMVVGTLAGAGLCAGAAAADEPGDLGAEDIQWFNGPVDQPDVVGGYASTHVIVQVQPGVELTEDAGGDVTFQISEVVGPQPGDEAGRLEAAFTAALEQWGVTSVETTMPFEPANPALAASHGLDRYYTLKVPAGTNVRAMADHLATFDDMIERAEVDGIGGLLGGAGEPNDPSFNVQYGLHNTGQTIQGQPGVAGADINAVAAWELHTGTDDITVAVIDTGAIGNHPDLVNKLVGGYNAIDGSSNTEDSVLIPHGTHVSGIAAADTNNGTGIAGVSWGANIMPVKVLNVLGGGNETDIANGVIWSADNGAEIGNMSLGVPDGIAYFEDACAYAHDLGMLIVAASGNTPGAPIGWPAAWDTVVAVGATDNRDELADFTTTGPEMSVSAPGVDVYSTYGGWLGGDYEYQSGTSMASPHVAGAAALVWSANPDLTNDEVWSILEESADDLGSTGWDPQFGHGRINAYEALLLATEPGCETGDLNCDGVVNGADLGMLLSAWGPCANPDDCEEDLDGDGVVNGADLGVLLSNWD